MMSQLTDLAVARVTARLLRLPGRALAASAVALWLGGAALAGDQLSIRSVAPEKSVIVVGVDDIVGSRERLLRTPLGAWWNSKDVQTEAKEWSDQFEKALNDMTQQLGVPRETVQWPASAGIAIFMQLDEAMGVDVPAVIAFIDWGKQGENFGKLYDAATTKLEKEKPGPFKTDDLKGHRVYIFGGDEEEKAGDKMPGGMEEDSNPFGLKQMCVTRDGSRLLIASSLKSLDDLLQRATGAKSKTVADTDDWKGTMGLMTSGGSPDFYAAALLRSGPSMGPFMPNPMIGMMMPLVSMIFGDVKAIAATFTLDGKSAPLESAIGLYLPEGKHGLFTLPVAAPVEKAPSIVASDAIAYGRANVKIADLPKVVEDIIAGLPEAMRNQLKEPMEAFMPKIKEGLSAMGPTFHFWSTVKQPVSENSVRNVLAVSVSDAKKAQGLLQAFGPQMGLQSRDFLGNTVFASESADQAFGFGGSYLFLGPTSEVEQSLRALGTTDSRGLEGDPAYRQAMGALAKEDLVGYGFSNTIATIELQHAMLEKLRTMEGADGGEADHGNVDVPGLPLDADFDFRKLATMLRPDLLKDYIGPSVWQLRSLKDGFKAEYMLLGPTKPAGK